MTESKNFMTVKQVAEKYPAFPQGGLRFMIFHADKNGFDRCLRRVGRKVLVEEGEFLRWVDKNGGAE